MLVRDIVKRTWKPDSALEEKWNTLKTALVDAAKTTIGFEKRRYPDWFRENMNVLEPLFYKRNQQYLKWLGSGSSSDKVKFSKARSEARRAVRDVKNRWFMDKAEEAQKVRFGGKKVWQCIRDMQYGRRGLVPSRLTTVDDEQENPFDTGSPAGTMEKALLKNFERPKSIF